jgi:hypothetical protein
VAGFSDKPLRLIAVILLVLSIGAAAQDVTTSGVTANTIPRFTGTKFKLQEVARTLDAAPGVASQIGFVSAPSLNSQGSIVFQADGAVLLKSGDEVSIVAAPNDEAPGEGKYAFTETPAINDQGKIVFRGTVLAPGKSGLFVSVDGDTSLLLADGTVAPSGDTVGAPASPSINANGDVAFVSTTGVFVISNSGVITELAGTNQAAPGGDTFTQFFSPAINKAGQVVFLGTLTSGNTGVFLASGGTITKIVAEGDQFPNGGILTFVLGAPSINNAGQVAFTGFSDSIISPFPDNPFQDSGVFLFSDGVLQLTVPVFTPVSNGVSLALILSASLNDAGQIVFIAQQSDLGSPTGVFLCCSGGLVTQVMKPGQPSPDGDTFNAATGALSAQINNSGQVVFASRMTQHNDAIYLVSNNQTSRVAGQGDPINRTPRFLFPFNFGMTNDARALIMSLVFPGRNSIFTGNSDDESLKLMANVGQPVSQNGVLATIVNTPAMNRTGQVVSKGTLSSGKTAILLNSNNTLTPIVRSSLFGDGDPTPGGGTLFSIGAPAINDLGEVFFDAQSTAAGQSGFFKFSNGSSSLLLSHSTPLPGGGRANRFSRPAPNNLGQVAFFAQPFRRPNSLFLLSQGILTTIARVGDPAPGGGTFIFFGFSDPSFGPVINDNGDVAFAADLSTGGRGVFLLHQGTLTRIAGPGDTAPGGGALALAELPSINASGQIAFSGLVQGDSGFGAFLFSGGQIVNVARAGQRFHGRQLAFGDSPNVNDNGQVAFTGGFSDGKTAVFIATPLADHDMDSDNAVDENDGPSSVTDPQDHQQPRRAIRPEKFPDDGPVTIPGRPDGF